MKKVLSKHYAGNNTALNVNSQILYIHVQK